VIAAVVLIDVVHGKDVRVAQNCRHGRADLVAHVREELALCEARALREFFGLEEFVLDLDLLCHVLERAAEPDDLTAFALGLPE